MAITQLLASPGAQFFANGNTYTANGTTGLITNYVAAGSTATVSGININDINELLGAGATFVSKRARYQTFSVPLTASATGIVSSASLTNGTLTIAAQPDVPRVLQYVIFPGTTALSSGTLTLAYTDEVGSSITDTVSLVLGASATTTGTTTRGCAVLASGIVTGIGGGASPGIQVGTNAWLAISTEVGAVGQTIVKAVRNGANTTSANITGSTQPLSTDLNVINPAQTSVTGTDTLSFGMTFFST